MPALLSLIALFLFTAIVWWRVLERHTSTTSSSRPTTSAKPTAHGSVPPCSANPVTLPRPTDVSVNVYNGAGRNGLAASTKIELQHRGFHVPLIGNAPRALSGVAQIQAGPSGQLQARLLQLYFPGATVVRSTRAGATVDLLLGAGFTSVAPQTQVDAAVAAAARKC